MDFQDSTDGKIKVWVDQRSVGDSGDSFEGTVCIELPDKKYLVWSYSI